MFLDVFFCGLFSVVFLLTLHPNIVSHFSLVLLIFLPPHPFHRFSSSLFSILNLNHFSFQLSFLPSFFSPPLTFSTLAIFLPSGRRDSRWRWYNDTISTLCLPVPESRSPGLSEIISHFVVGTIIRKIDCCSQPFSHRSMKSHYFLLMFLLRQNSPSYWNIHFLTNFPVLCAPCDLTKHSSFFFFLPKQFKRYNFISNKMKRNNFLWICQFPVNLGDASWKLSKITWICQLRQWWLAAADSCQLTVKTASADWHKHYLHRSWEGDQSHV